MAGGANMAPIVPRRLQSVWKQSFAGLAHCWRKLCAVEYSEIAGYWIVSHYIYFVQIIKERLVNGQNI